MKRSVLAICVLALLAGCVSQPPQIAVSVGGQPEVNSSSFTFDGWVAVYADRTDKTYTVENATLVLYSADGDVIKTAQVGTLTTNSDRFRVNVSVRSERVPAYITVEADGLWQSDIRVVIDGWRRTDHGFQQFEITSRDQLFADRS
jgi:hypothetical protein